MGSHLLGYNEPIRSVPDDTWMMGAPRRAVEHADRTCKTCGETKPVDAFRTEGRYTNARRSECRACENVKKKAHRHATSAARRERDRERKRELRGSEIDDPRPQDMVPAAAKQELTLLHADWSDRAACRDWPADWMFPEYERTRQREYRAEVEHAKMVCETCQVKAECLAAALEAEGDVGADWRHGVWGGLNPAERAKLRRDHGAE